MVNPQESSTRQILNFISSPSMSYSYTSESSSSSSDESDQCSLSNDGRFVYCLFPKSCNRRHIITLLDDHDYSYHRDSIQISKALPQFTTKKVYITFQTAHQASRFIEDELSLDTFNLHPKLVYSVPTSVLERYPLIDNNLSDCASSDSDDYLS
ncbi:hypothetical protein GEMRC1_000537 [Eukaryota sp. GEM-RC1]